MAFTASTFARIGPQNSGAPTLWSYATTDATTAVDGLGYFNAAADVLQVGDFIMVAVSGATGGFAIVNSNTRDLAANPPVAGVVDTTNVVALGAIDSD
jgi:Ethanolamine utilization protein EutJ (predicted chaperonin)